MSFSEAARFEFRGMPVERFVADVLPSLSQFEILRRFKDFINVLGVVFPICRDIQRAACL